MYVYVYSHVYILVNSGCVCEREGESAREGERKEVREGEGEKERKREKGREGERARKKERERGK